MLVTIDQLEIGDEIIVPIMSKFRYYRVERKPEPKKGNPKTWDGRPLYKAVRCSYRTYKVSVTSTYSARPFEVEEYATDGENHDKYKSIDLNWKHIWLIRKLK